MNRLSGVKATIMKKEVSEKRKQRRRHKMNTGTHVLLPGYNLMAFTRQKLLHSNTNVSLIVTHNFKHAVDDAKQSFIQTLLSVISVTNTFKSPQQSRRMKWGGHCQRLVHRVEGMASKDILKLSEVGPASCSGLLGRDKRRKNLTNRTNGGLEMMVQTKSK